MRMHLAVLGQHASALISTLRCRSAHLDVTSVWIAAPHPAHTTSLPVLARAAWEPRSYSILVGHPCQPENGRQGLASEQVSKHAAELFLHRRSKATSQHAHDHLLASDPTASQDCSDFHDETSPASTTQRSSPSRVQQAQEKQLQQQAGRVRIRRRCKHPTCATQPTYNTEGQLHADYCSPHKLPGMVNVTKRTCQFDGCRKIPTFNVEGLASGLYCGSHKAPGMVNVVSKRCEDQNCDRIPHFNNAGSSSGVYCTTHKRVGMVNVTSNRCQHRSCSKIAVFKMIHLKAGQYCSAHKKPNMVDVKHRFCDKDGCRIRASFSIPGKPQLKFCVAHKQPGMIHTNKFKQGGPKL